MIGDADGRSGEDEPNHSPVALVTGITGQDGSYLAELLLSKGYVVHGLVRRSSSTRRSRLDHLFARKDVYDHRLFLHYADLDDATTIRRVLLKTRPDEFYHLAGQSHVGVSFETPESTCQFTGMGTLGLLEIIRDLDKQPRFLHVSSSEVFGRPDSWPQNESTPMRPVSPYGVGKTFATNMTRVYRESFNVFACNAICFNHESPRRGESFVTRKITRTVAAISLGLETRLKMGNVDAIRDWGSAPEYVDAMWRMLRRDQPSDYVLATGRQNRVDDFLRLAFDVVGLDWRNYYEVDPRFIRPAENGILVGDATLAKRDLGWRATTTLPELVRWMVDADIASLKQETQ